jgi:nitrite reductase (cytochrome c-552)
MSSTKFGGSELRNYLEDYPFLLVLYEGYDYSKMFGSSRGHMFALDDVLGTERPKLSASCLTCKTSEFAFLYESMGDNFWLAPLDEVITSVEHTIGCLDCHNPVSMELRPVRTYIEEALERMGGVNGGEKMRNVVCAQCHVEFYFGPDNQIILPWDNGLTIEDIEEYYDERNHSDWIHPRTGTALIKVKHPEYELFRGSIHDVVGTTCGTCHMPSVRLDNGNVQTPHWWNSPLNNMEESCSACHRDLSDLRKQVEDIQSEVYILRQSVGEKITSGVEALVTALESGAEETLLDEGRALHRRAQLYWDFIFAENSTGFHNANEARRVLQNADKHANLLLELLADYR